MTSRRKMRSIFRKCTELPLRGRVVEGADPYIFFSLCILYKRIDIKLSIHTKLRYAR